MQFLDKTFWKFLSGFLIILIVSFSILTAMGVFRDAKDTYASIWHAFSQ